MNTTTTIGFVGQALAHAGDLGYGRRDLAALFAATEQQVPITKGTDR